MSALSMPEVMPHHDLPLAGRFLDSVLEHATRSVVLNQFTARCSQLAPLVQIVPQLEAWYTNGKEGAWATAQGTPLLSPTDLFLNIKIADKDASDLVLDVIVQVSFTKSLDVLPWTKGASTIAYTFVASSRMPTLAGASANELDIVGRLYLRASIVCKKMVEVIQKAAKATKINLSLHPYTRA